MWAELFENIQVIIPLANTADLFVCKGNAEGIFSVKSCYDRFKPMLSGPPICALISAGAVFLRMVRDPPKILFFGWGVIHNRIATEDQLIKWGYCHILVIIFLFSVCWRLKAYHTF